MVNNNNKKRKIVTKNPEPELVSEEDELQNSEEDYESSEHDSASEDQIGGTDDEASTDFESDFENRSIDLDPDDEEDVDADGDDKYNPIDEAPENEDDPDEDESEDIEEIVEGDDEEGEGEGEGGDENDIDTDTFKGKGKTCYLKSLNEENINFDEDDSSMYGTMEYKKVPKNERISDPILTYYEQVRVIGTRTQQFSLGAPPLVSGVDGLHPAKKAYLELMAKKTPYKIKRHLPGKKYEQWKIEELEIIHVIDDNFFVPENYVLDKFVTDNNIILPTNPSDDSPKSAIGIGKGNYNFSIGLKDKATVSKGKTKVNKSKGTSKGTSASASAKKLPKHKTTKGPSSGSKTGRKKK